MRGFVLHAFVQRGAQSRQEATSWLEQVRTFQTASPHAGGPRVHYCVYMGAAGSLRPRSSHPPSFRRLPSSIGTRQHLRLQHISLPKDEGAEVQGAFALERTKTGENQSVRLRKGATTTLLRALVVQRLREGGDKLFTFTAGHFRTWIKAECTSLGLGDIGFTPHSLRHGGATADFLRGMSVNDIQLRGRWRCFESLRRYLQQSLHAPDYCLWSKLAWTYFCVPKIFRLRRDCSELRP